MNEKKTTVEILSELEMVGFLKTNGTQCRYVSLVSETQPKLKKTCPFFGVRKISRKVGLINANYNTSVRRRIAEKHGLELKEVEYENGEVWYRHLTTVEGKPLPVVVNKKDESKHYLQFFPQKSEDKYVDSEGVEIAEDLLEPHFYARKERDDYKPVVISISLSNVKRLVASGVIMQTEDIDEAEAILG